MLKDPINMGYGVMVWAPILIFMNAESIGVEGHLSITRFGPNRWVDGVGTLFLICLQIAQPVISHFFGTRRHGPWRFKGGDHNFVLFSIYQCLAQNLLFYLIILTISKGKSCKGEKAPRGKRTYGRLYDLLEKSPGLVHCFAAH